MLRIHEYHKTPQNDKKKKNSKYNQKPSMCCTGCPVPPLQWSQTLYFMYIKSEKCSQSIHFVVVLGEPASFPAHQLTTGRWCRGVQYSQQQADLDVGPRGLELRVGVHSKQDPQAARKAAGLLLQQVGLGFPFEACQQHEGNQSAPETGIWSSTDRWYSAYEHAGLSAGRNLHWSGLRCSPPAALLPTFNSIDIIFNWLFIHLSGFSLLTPLRHRNGQ